MSSEIPSMLKLSPVTVVQTANKQTEDRNSSNIENTDPRSSVGLVNQNELQVTNQQEGGGVGSEKKAGEASPELIKQAVDEVNTFLQATKRNLQFKVDDETDELVVKIVDADSGKLVRQIPSEEMLAFIKRMQELDGKQGFVLQDRA